MMLAVAPAVLPARVSAAAGCLGVLLLPVCLLGSAALLHASLREPAREYAGSAVKKKALMFEETSGTAAWQPYSAWLRMHAITEDLTAAVHKTCWWPDIYSKDQALYVCRDYQ
jgi:hypothetical protein